MNAMPTRLDKQNATEMLVEWNTGEKFTLPFAELRFYCPCAGCVDEHSGERTIQRSQVAADIRPTAVHVVGRYAAQITWSDGHATGMYHFDRLHELCTKLGRKL
ncbi:MAG: DUF971 domain-containing protein [Bdellovibrionota bacterium]